MDIKMGCFTSREERKDVEEMIVKAEHELGYYRKGCNEVNNIHRKYSYDGVINSHQFLEISKRLKLAVYRKPSPQFDSFYKNFLKGKENYSQFSLLILGMLLSRGMIPDKAKILFEICDTEAKKVLAKEKIAIGFEEMFKISADFLPKLAGDNDDLMIQQYCRRLRGNMTSLVKKIVEDIFGGAEEIGLEKFVEKMCEIEHSKIMSPSFLRKVVIEYKNNENL
jgi:hypothetical protein